MSKYIRVLIAVVVVLGLVLLARDQIAWAQPDESAQSQDEASVSLHKDKDCDKYKNQKDKEKNKCQDDPNGSVLPPADDIKVCKRGDYSVGGVATLDVKNLKGRDCLTAHASDPVDVQPIPPGAGMALTDVVDLTLPEKGGILKICFAAPPGENVKIYSSQGGSWFPVKTQVKKGIACAEIKKSGNYTLVGK